MRDEVAAEKRRAAVTPFMVRDTKVFLTLSRMMVVLMAGVLCFTLLVPMALRNHQPWLAAGVGIVFAAYAVANIFLWRRMKPRA